MTDEVRQIEDMIEVVARMIPREKQAQNIYRETAAWAPTEATRILFERLAEEESGHEKKLEAVMNVLRQELDEAKERAKQ